MQILENMERLSDFCNPKQEKKKSKTGETKHFHGEPKNPEKKKESKPR